ncbi:hypothetical protein SISNIDRAFT_468415 [Sistotremastrum niveocremeum HHB9708]|uniref:EF-hand domain-containing protein n=1 Tax=Sistotremastrum niveocremeum HHB9708 TaxID=1314777 RepID=A0A164RKK9_9AGAM|nr:hypothetical protein SISNIDRAFT_468415 [Sistotremastrum niveocremeum HHB9708]
MLLAASLAVSMLSLGARADCCEGVELCPDCTEATPCCGYGKCNIFCCNCDGGCRGFKGKLTDQMHPHVGGAVDADFDDTDKCTRMFHATDANGDGQLTLIEYLVHAYENPKSNAWAFVRDAEPEAIEKYWRKYDVDGKGYLTISEALTRA